MPAAVGLLVFAVACSSSKKPEVRMIGGIMFGLMSLGASIATLNLISIGFRNNWSSDGPGMLFVMIGMVFFGAAAVFGWWITASVLYGKRKEQ